MNKIFLLIFLFLNHSHLIFPQSPPFKQFRSSDGLPSPNVYDCMLDKDGYMWFATENGISRFDYHSFQNFSKNEGLNSNFILSIIEKENEIFIGTKSDGINTFRNNFFSNLNYKESPRLWINKLVLHKDKIYKYSSANISFIEGDSSNIICEFNLNTNASKRILIINWMHSFNNERLLVATSKGIYEIKERQFEKLSIPEIDNSQIYCVTSDKDNYIYASGENAVYKIYNDKIIETYRFNFSKEKKIFRLLVDNKNKIWFQILNEGLFVFNPYNSRLIDMNKKIDVPKLHVNNFYMDNKFNIWVCTYGEGVYCFYNTFIDNYNVKDGLSNSKINSISGDKYQRIFCGTFNGLSVLENDNFFTLRSSGEVKVTDFIRCVNKTNDSAFVINYVNEEFKFYKTMYRNVLLLYSPLKISIFVNNDTLISGGYTNGVYFSNPYTNSNPESRTDYHLVVRKDSSLNGINGLSLGKNGRIWIASDLGISLFYQNKMNVIQKDKLNNRFFGIREDRNGYTWAWGEKGLFILKDSIIVTEFSKNKSNNIASMEFDSEDRAWLSTSIGLLGMSVKYEEGKAKLEETYLLNENAGLVSNDISSIYYDKGKNFLWAGTSSGLSSVDLNGFEHLLKDSIFVRILEVKTPDSVYNLTGNIYFPESEKEISITVSSFNINSTGNLIYQYKLSAEDTSWSSSDKNVIIFPSLTYGDYNFQVRAKNSFGKTSEASVLNFTVATPFEKSFLFYGLIVFSALALTILVVSRSLKKKYSIEKERSSFRNQISELKQKSLASMMNPHFVFNSLNSIQSFYNYKENESANMYLAKFSRLIRMNLDFADRTFIKLSDEIERLESYLILEKMRFDDNLNYKIWVSNDIDPEKTNIPNMIIQPFVENAIWHGILKSQKTGKVWVNIFHSELPEKIRRNYKIQTHDALGMDSNINANPFYCIKIEIIDNGIGINECLTNKTSNHISRGISVIKERLSILHHHSGETDLVKITDRSEIKHSETGTIVEIFLTPNVCKINKD